MNIKNVRWTDAITSLTHSVAECDLSPDSMRALLALGHVEVIPKFFSNRSFTPSELKTPEGLQAFLDTRPDGASTRPYLIKFPVRGTVSGLMAAAGCIRGESSNLEGKEVAL